MNSLIVLLHLAAAIVWLGGMTCLLWAVRPTLMTQLEGPARLRFLAQMWGRFFNAVLLAVVVLLATGGHLYASGFRALKAAGPGMPAGLPLGWSVMAALGTLMVLVFGHIYFASFRKFKRLLEADRFAEAATAAGRIHQLVVLNFCLGWAAVVAIRLL
ncbi:MAG: hypothetical protein RLZZ126_1162 [Pseudomonadota bacterium]|jgi:uncharacterized membrane protein